MKTLIMKLSGIPEKKKDIILLLLRLTVGIVFIQTGLGKFQNFDQTVAFFASIGLPFADANAFLAAATELVGGALILLGLGTRFIVFPLVVVMIVALGTAHANDITSISALVSLRAWDYLVSFLVLGAFGAGKFSVDSKLGN